MLDILKKIRNDECEYLKGGEFEKLSNWIAKTIDSTTRKQNRIRNIPHAFSDIDLPGTPANAMLTLFNESVASFKKLKSLADDEESAAKYIKQLLLFYGVGAALYNKYYDSTIIFDHKQYTYDLILYEINIYQGCMTSSPTLIFNFKLYGGDYYNTDAQITVLFDESSDCFPAELDKINISIRSWINVTCLPTYIPEVLSECNADLFKAYIKDAIDEESKGRN